MSKKQTSDAADSISSKGQAAPTSSPGADSIASDVDDSYQAYKHRDVQEIDPAEAKRVLRKIDWRIVPILFGTYLISYIDKNGLIYASA